MILLKEPTWKGKTKGPGMKKSERYNYITGKQITEPGSRVYEISGMRLPSVTTILAKTKNQEYLTAWKKRVGNEEAERIKNLSSKRGTAMHKFLEKHILGEGYEDLTEIGQQAKPMAQKIIDIGLTPITEYYGSEVTLHYPGLYAGSTDLVCMHNDMETIIDFKQSNRPKKEEWIEDYYLQIAAYAMAHDQIYGSNIRQGVILVCTPDLYMQEFRFQDADMRKWRHKFLKRLDEYYEIMREPDIKTVSEESQDELEPIKDFLEEAEKEKKELEESYQESVRQTEERKEKERRTGPIDSFSEDLQNSIKKSVESK